MALNGHMVLLTITYPNQNGLEQVRHRSFTDINLNLLYQAQKSGG